MASYAATTLSEVERSILYNEFNNKTLNLDTVSKKDPRYNEFVNQATGQNLLVNALRRGDYGFLNNVPAGYRNQESFMLPLLFAVKNGPNVTYAVFSYFSPELQNNPQLGEMIIRDEPNLIKNTPLASNKDFIIHNAKQYPAILQYASPTIISDPTIRKEFYSSVDNIQPIKAVDTAAPAVAAVAAAETINQALQGNTNKKETIEEDQEADNKTIFDVQTYIANRHKRDKSVAQVQEEADKNYIKEENKSKAIYAAMVREGTATSEDLLRQFQEIREQLEKRKSITNPRELFGSKTPRFSGKQFEKQIELLKQQGIDVSEFEKIKEELSQESSAEEKRVNDILFEEFKKFAKVSRSLSGGAAEFSDWIKRFLPEDVSKYADVKDQLWKLLYKEKKDELSPEEFELLETTIGKINAFIGKDREPETITYPKALNRISLIRAEIISTHPGDQQREAIISKLDELKSSIMDNYRARQYGDLDSVKFEDALKTIRSRPEEYIIGDLLYHEPEGKISRYNVRDVVDGVDTKTPPQPNQAFRETTIEEPQQTPQPAPAKPIEKKPVEPKSIESTIIQNEAGPKKGTREDATAMTRGVCAGDMKRTMSLIEKMQRRTQQIEAMQDI